MIPGITGHSGKKPHICGHSLEFPWRHTVLLFELLVEMPEVSKAALVRDISYRHIPLQQ